MRPKLKLKTMTDSLEQEPAELKATLETLIVEQRHGDEQTTILDLTRLVNHLNGRTPLAATNLPLADINGDGLLDQSDADALAGLILGAPTPPTPVTLEPASGATEIGRAHV